MSAEPEKIGTCEHCGETNVELFFHPVLETFSDGLGCGSCIKVLVAPEPEPDPEAIAARIESLRWIEANT